MEGADTAVGTAGQLALKAVLLELFLLPSLLPPTDTGAAEFRSDDDLPQKKKKRKLSDIFD